MSSKQAQSPPHIDIVFLGSPDVGKATFLSRLPHVQHPSVTRRNNEQVPVVKISGGSLDSNAGPNNSQTTLVEPSMTASSRSNDSLSTLVPPEAETAQLSSVASPSRPYPSQPGPLTHPLSFNTLLYARPYHITIHPSTSPLFIDPFPTSPDLLILTFSIPDRASLFNIRHYWMPQWHLHYPTSTVPILLLGLKRDLRTAKKRQIAPEEDGVEKRKVIEYRHGNADGEPGWEYECIMPEEAVQAAREMRVDRYAECSAVTGELMWEAVQDITKMAAETTLDREYSTEMCSAM